MRYNTKKNITYDNYEITNIFDIPYIFDINENSIKQYVLSGETPEEVSYHLYGTSEYYWVLLMLNNVVNPNEDWYMSSNTLRVYTTLKYNDSDEPNYFYDVNTKQHLTQKLSNDMRYLLDNNMELPHNISFKTNFEYEVEQNEKKKTIKAIHADKIVEFINTYNERMKLL